MHKVYINGISSISAQPIDIMETGNKHDYHTNILDALEQDYRSMIKPMMLRRMSTAVKMGLFNSRIALMQGGIEKPEAIIVGTGQGCLQDTEKFLKNMILSEEGLLSPTSFIQSTHNTVAGQIALDLKCNAYNMTYTQNSASFESALIDGLLQIKTGAVSNALVGGVDETSEKLTGFQEIDGQLKKERLNNLELLQSPTSGSIASSASAFFMLSTEKNDDTYAELIDVDVQSHGYKNEIKVYLSEFLKKNRVQYSDIDILISGRNGDSRFGGYYESMEKTFPKALQLAYKHLVGENHTIASYAVWMASKILKQKNIPEVYKLNEESYSGPGYILIYNQYLGRNHAFILLKEI